MVPADSTRQFCFNWLAGVPLDLLFLPSSNILLPFACHAKTAFGVPSLVSHDLQQYWTIREIRENPRIPRGLQKYCCSYSLHRICFIMFYDYYFVIMLYIIYFISFVSSWDYSYFWRVYIVTISLLNIHHHIAYLWKYWSAGVSFKCVIIYEQYFIRTGMLCIFLITVIIVCFISFFRQHIVVISSMSIHMTGLFIEIFLLHTI